MGKMLTVIGGAAAVAIGLWGLATWWWSFLDILKGTMPCFLILGGLLAFFAGISELKDNKVVKKEEKNA